jgi:RNA polymerase sigma-70 factor (ECF subfamily)
MSTVSISRRDAIPTRYSLLSRLQKWDDQESWKDFFDIYWRFIYSVAVKSGLTEDEAQDVVQETVISVAKHIQKFKRDRALGSFKGWLRNIIRWRIADQLEKRTPGLRNRATGDRDAWLAVKEIPDGDDPMGEAWEAEWRDNLFQAAIQRVKRKVKEEHYLAFDLYVLRNWPVLKVARKLGVSVGQVYLVKHRVAALLRRELQVLEEKPF